MLKLADIRAQISQRLRELFPKARGWDESLDVRIGRQTASLLVKFGLGDREHAIVLEVSSLGQPRQIRAAVTRLTDLRREMPGAYPAAAAVYIGPESARILKSHGFGYVDLSGNCHLAFENVLIEKEGKRNVRPSTRPLRSLFAPRATRVIRVLLEDAGRLWRLEELAKEAGVSLGHSHNVVKRLEDLRWVERDARQRITLSKPADLLDAWADSYTYRGSEISSYAAPERVSRRLMVEIARAASAGSSSDTGRCPIPCDSTRIPPASSARRSSQPTVGLRTPNVRSASSCGSGRSESRKPIGAKRTAG